MASKKKDKNTGLVRIEERVIQEVQKHTSVTKQSIGGFFAIAAKEKLEKEKK